MIEIILYLISGIFIGSMAGLFGIGGGLLIVPVVTYSLVYFHNVSFYIALLSGVSTSLASIIFSGIVASITHIKNKNFDMGIFRRFMWGVLFGSLVIGFFLKQIPTEIIKTCFIFYTFLAAYKIIKQQTGVRQKIFPAELICQSIGAIFATLSGLIGIGGGTLFVPYLLSKNIMPKLAVGIASVLGLVIGIGSSCTIFFAAGTTEMNHMVGYIYLPAIVFLTLPSLLFVKLSATWLLSIPDTTIKKAFAALLVVIGILMLINPY